MCPHVLLSYRNQHHLHLGLVFKTLRVETGTTVDNMDKVLKPRNCITGTVAGGAAVPGCPLTQAQGSTTPCSPEQEDRSNLSYILYQPTK